MALVNLLSKPILLLLAGILIGGTYAQDQPYELNEAEVSPDYEVDQETLAKIQENPETEALSYLEKYGYTGKNAQDQRLADQTDSATVAAALMRFQRSAGVPESGIIDAATMKAMSWPRCGVLDDAAKTDGMKRRRKRYARQGSKWSRPNLRYHITETGRTGRNLGDPLVDRIMARALKVWSDVANLNFQKVRSSEPADITVLFGSRSHGDGEPFDGPRGTLAHAYFPRYGGDAHFDDDETFTDSRNSGTNLFQVAAHEFGHSLGLGHSEDPNALMAPFYRGYKPNFQLPADDRRGIRAIYGDRVTQPQTTTTTTRKPPPTAAPAGTTRRPGVSIGPARTTRRPGPSSCKTTFDAISNLDDSISIAFSGPNYYLFTQRSVVQGYPRRIASDFSGVVTVDAVHVISGRRPRLFIFTNSKVFVFDQTSSGTYAKVADLAISGLISGLPSNIDAVFEWPGSKRLYIFKGNQYYRITSNRQGNFVDRGYPKSLSAWRLPSSVQKISSVVHYVNGHTYFFTGDQYYRYDDTNVRAVTSGYPRSTAANWLYCKLDSYQDNGGDPTTIDPNVIEHEIEASEDDFFVVKTVEEISEGLGANNANSLSALITPIYLISLYLLGSVLFRIDF